MSILDQNLLTLDFWQNTVTYGGHTMPTGRIGCAALNISDEQIGQLAQLCLPLSMIVAAIGSGTITRDVFLVAEQNILSITQMLRGLEPFSYINYPADGHDVRKIFSEDRIDNTMAYIEAVSQVGAAAAMDEEYKYGVGIIKLISTMAQLAGTLQIYKQSMTAFADALHDSKRTPDDYAAVFAKHFETVSLDDPSWTALTNVTAQYIADIMPGKDAPQLVKRMHYVSFVGMLRSDLFEGLCVGHAPRKCPVCGRWFLTTDARLTKYCDGIAPGNSKGLTCRQVASWRNRKDRELAADHPVKKIYTRRMNTIIQGVNRGSLDPALAEKMKFLGKQKMEKALSDLSYYKTRYEQEMTQAALRAEAEKK